LKNIWSILTESALAKILCILTESFPVEIRPNFAESTSIIWPNSVESDSTKIRSSQLWLKLYQIRARRLRSKLDWIWPQQHWAESITTKFSRVSPDWNLTIFRPSRSPPKLAQIWSSQPWPSRPSKNSIELASIKIQSKLIESASTKFRSDSIESASAEFGQIRLD